MPRPVELVDGVDVDAVAAAVRGCVGVADLSSGRIGEVATYLPGRRVPGIRVHDDSLEVHVTVPYGPTVDEVAAQVRRAVSGLAGPRTVDVAVDDIVLEPEEPAEPAEPPARSTPGAPAAVRTSAPGTAVIPPTTIDPGGATAPLEITMPPAPPRVR